MKNNFQVFTVGLILLTTVAVAQKRSNNYNAWHTNPEGGAVHYALNEPIHFIERGVEFLVFNDGSFDFNTQLNYGTSAVYFKTKNGKMEKNRVKEQLKKDQQGRFILPQGTVVLHDIYGRVRRIGNVFINYNAYNQVKRIGSVYLNYNRFRWVKQIGGLHLKYNRLGTVIAMHGAVHFNRNTYANYQYNHYNPTTGLYTYTVSDPFFNHDPFFDQVVESTYPLYTDSYYYHNTFGWKKNNKKEKS